jgi:pimeloyl-ACP methyl ester carboxylesterase
MGSNEVEGPLEWFEVGDGVRAPFYVIPFNKKGDCTARKSRAGLVAAATDATDVFLFSHGWNNDWDTAMARYRAFIASYGEEHRTRWNPPTRAYKPVLVGVFWPSTALVAPWERQPEIAAEGPQEPELEYAADVEALSELLAPKNAARLRSLAARPELDEAEIAELATIVSPMISGGDDEIEAEVSAPSPDELVQTWQEVGQVQVEPGFDDDEEPGGFIDERPIGAPAAAGILDKLDPRLAIRLTTVRVMKDRAGRVGAAGVAEMLHDVLAASKDARVRLVGHSYGAKVVLSALCVPPAPSRPVESVLLLQPAVSCLCFATDVDGSGRPGGYRPALERTHVSIMTTFSRHDAPLTRFFHLAVRRKADLGEARIAGAPPSRFAALGGFGPQGATADVSEVTARRPGDRYPSTDPARRIVAIEADELIHGHGDVTNPATAWALLNQVMA